MTRWLAVVVVCVVAFSGTRWVRQATNRPQASQWIGFPVVPPIADADPSVRQTRDVQVPTRLNVVRTADGIGYGLDGNSLETVQLDVGLNMIVGRSWEAFVYQNGQMVCPAGSGLGGLGGWGGGTPGRCGSRVERPGSRAVGAQRRAAEPRPSGASRRDGAAVWSSDPTPCLAGNRSD